MTNRDKYNQLDNKRFAILIAQNRDCDFCECQDSCDGIHCVERLAKWLDEEVDNDKW